MGVRRVVELWGICESAGGTFRAVHRDAERLEDNDRCRGSVRVSEVSEAGKLGSSQVGGEGLNPQLGASV